MKRIGRYFMLFFKGIIVGFGGIAPGLSGSVLLIIFGLYQQTLEYISNLFTDTKKKLRFLIPLVSGMITGVLLFSRLIDFLLKNHEMQTRYAFLGLIVGTIPMLYKEVKKKGFSIGYYGVIVFGFILGTLMFNTNASTLNQITEPSLLRSIILGIAVSITAIVPGIDPAVLLSSIGFYELYIHSLATLDIIVLLPMLVGVIIGAIFVSSIMTFLFKRFYTAVFSFIFGIFISMIPNMLNESCSLGFNGLSIASIFIMFIGILTSLYLSNKQKNNEESENN